MSILHPNKEADDRQTAGYNKCGNDSCEEVRRLTALLSRATRRAERWERRAKMLSKHEALLAAEQSAQILRVKPYLVRELGDRYGLSYALVNNRRFYRRRDIEKLRAKMLRESEPRNQRP